MGTSFRHELIAEEFLDFFSLWPDSHMSIMDISSLHELIADEFISGISLRLGSQMRHMDISSIMN